MNSLHNRLTQEIAESEKQQAMRKANKTALPDSDNVDGLEDYRSFKAIDNEGKNLFDFVTSSVWNACRLIFNWLGEIYTKDNDRVDLLYAILNCQGWIRSDEKWGVVRMEQLQHPPLVAMHRNSCAASLPTWEQRFPAQSGCELIWATHPYEKYHVAGNCPKFKAFWGRFRDVWI